MNRSDLVRYVSDKTLITERDAGIIVDVCLDGIKEGLDSDGKVTLKNFGSFFLQKRQPRTALNPKNQEVIQVPAKTVVKFKSSNKLYDLMKNKN